MAFMHRYFLPGSRPGIDPARSPIIAHPVIDGRIIDDGPVYISVMHHGGIDPRHRRIIPEMTAIPLATIISMPPISISIIYSAIKTDMRTPITRMPGIDPTYKSPITRGPQITNRRRRLPITRHPIIIIIAISPVTRYPYISIGRAKRLLINRDSRRRYPNRDPNANLGIDPRDRQSYG